MNLNDLTIGQVKELMCLVGQQKQDCNHPYTIGKNYIVRTVTMIFTGRLVKVLPQELVMVDVSWIPETDRYMQFVEKGSVRECEPYPEGREVIIGRGAVLDAVILEVSLPRSQK